MGQYDFDQITERRGTSSYKYDAGPELTGRNDLLPMWVADMDFPLPEEILARINERVNHGIFGYTMIDDAYYGCVAAWFQRRYGWVIENEWITTTPGVVYGISTAIRAMTEPGDAVMIQEPVYYPFRSVIEKNGRICVNNQLRFTGTHYEIDFEDFRKKIEDYQVKALILCSPHNPVGRVWTEPELRRIRDICRTYGVTVISDEIHCDFAYPGNQFFSYGKIETDDQQFVICTAPSKTFNLAGLQASNIVIPNDELRRLFREENEKNGYSSIGTLAKTAVEAVYQMGDQWLDELLQYLEGNIRFVQDYLVRHIPQVRLIEPEGTYLIWLDFSRVADSPDQMREIIQDDARLWLDNGGMFSEQTWMFERMNIACPRSVLERALKQLEIAVRHRLDECYSTEWIMEWYREEEK